MPSRSLTHFLRSLVRFRLRSLLVVMLLVSLACGYLGKHLYRKSIERPIVARIEAAGGEAFYDYEVDNYRVHPMHFLRGSPKGHWLVRRLLGDDIFASVAYVELESPWAGDSDVAMLSALPQLQCIALYGDTFGDASIAELLTVNRLKKLVLAGSQVTADELGKLATHPTLTHLEVRGNALTPSHIEQLTRFSQVEHLVIAGPLANKNEEIEVFTGLTKLRSLTIHDVQLSRDALKSIGTMHVLEELDLVSVNLSNRELELLTELSNLKRLNLENANITDAACDVLLQFTQLEELFIDRTSISEIGLQRLAALPQLENISVTLGDGLTLREVQEIQAATSQCQIDAYEVYPDGTIQYIDIASGDPIVD